MRAGVALFSEFLKVAARRAEVLIPAIHLAQRQRSSWIKPNRLRPTRKPRAVDLVALRRDLAAPWCQTREPSAGVALAALHQGQVERSRSRCQIGIGAHVH